MKYAVITRYYNPILKIWEDENTTLYLKKDFTSWADYVIINGSVQRK